MKVLLVNKFLYHVGDVDTYLVMPGRMPSMQPGMRWPWSG